MMNPTLRKVIACVCYTALIVIALGLIFGPLACFSQVAGRPASETYVAAKLNAHNATNNAHADIRAQVFAATTNVNALTIAATNATEAAHAATIQANAAILKNTQQDVDISYLYASNANTIAIANLANTRAQAANVTNAQNGAAIVSVSNLTVTAQATANAAVSGVTAVSNLVIGVKALNENAITNETDEAALAALAAYAAYWPRNATASSWFTFVTNSGAITITVYNIAGGTDVVIPDYINGWPVTVIGLNAFAGSGVTSIGGAGNVVTVGNYAFGSCTSLASISLPQAQTVEDNAFYYCTSLASIPLPLVQTVGDGAFYHCTSLASIPLPLVQTVGAYAFESCYSLASLYFDNDAPTIGANIFSDIPPNQVTNYVTNPQATGWGATLAGMPGMPVVRPTLYADAIYQAGELVATFSQIAASNALPYTAWTGTVMPAGGTATVAIAHGNMPVLVTGAPCVLTLDPTGYGTAGVSRVSLSYYPGTNSFTFATNVISYAETPTVDTNGWNTLLIRRVSDGAWKGVGL